MNRKLLRNSQRNNLPFGKHNFTSVTAAKMEGSTHDFDLEKCKVEVYDSNFLDASERFDCFRAACARGFHPLRVA
jgi:hypothetical protein